MGLELAQAFQKLGSQVTLIEGGPRMLPNHEEFARVQPTTALRQDGVEILTARRVVRLGRNGGAYVVTTSDHGPAEADRVLVAVGRKVPTADIGLQNVGLNPGGLLEVDEHMRVRGVSWLYATGDINGRAQFTHKGTYEARIAVDHILGDRTESQIAAAVGCSQMHVSRILAASLEALRTQAVATPWRLDTSGRATRSIGADDRVEPAARALRLASPPAIAA